jgi:hypothetical protein
MYQSLKNNQKIILIAGCFVALLAMSVFVIGKTTDKEITLSDNQKEVIAQAEQSQDLSLAVVGNSDSPLRISETRVKQISAFQFSQLTGKRTNLAFLSSVPEVRLTNVSQMPVTSFILVIRDPKGKKTRMLIQGKISIPPGETYIVKRQHFIKPEFLQNKNVPFELGMNSENFWIEFAPISDVYVTIGQLTFSDGSLWKISPEVK